MLTGLNARSDSSVVRQAHLIDQVHQRYFGATAESFISGSLISSRSLQRPVKRTESVSIGLNLIRAEGTRSSSSSVAAVSPVVGK